MDRVEVRGKPAIATLLDDVCARMRVASTGDLSVSKQAARSEAKGKGWRSDGARVTPAARQAVMMARILAGRMSPKRHGGLGAGACAKQEQLRCAFTAILGLEQSRMRSFGAQRACPRGLTALTIEPETWKHQQPRGTTRQPGVIACHDECTSLPPSAPSRYVSKVRLLDAHESMLLLFSVPAPCLRWMKALHSSPLGHDPAPPARNFGPFFNM